MSYARNKADMPVADTGYCLRDVEAAKRKILQAVPDAIVERGDYGFGLSVASADMTRAFIVFRPQRDDLGQSEVIGNVDAIIAGLR